MKSKPSFEISESDIALIAAYLRGQLDDTNKTEFEGRSVTDPHWPKKVEEVKALIRGVEEANMTAHVITWHDDMMTKNNGAGPTANIVPIYRRWWAVACLAVLILSGTWFFWPQKDPYETLYLAYFEPDMGLPIAMSTMDTAQYTLYDGLISYKEGNYIDALHKWSTIPLSDTLNYFSGVAYMGLGNMTEAKNRLLHVSTHAQSVFHQDAIWYLALCHLREGSIAEAIQYLRRIPKNSRSQELLHQLE